jgi:hypothetical protein
MAKKAMATSRGSPARPASRHALLAVSSVPATTCGGSEGAMYPTPHCAMRLKAAGEPAPNSSGTSRVPRGTAGLSLPA